MSEIKLKPCPFCGGEARVMKQFESGVEVGSKIVCFDCLANFYQGEAWDAEGNIDAWNQRAERVGEWELVDYHFGRGGGVIYKCANCGRVANDKSNYCPNCGARMEGGNDERI